MVIQASTDAAAAADTSTLAASNVSPTQGRRGLSPRLRASLDAVRGASAIYVVLHHLLMDAHLPRLVDAAFRFGQEAVIIFFMLSGFVIYANERERGLRLKGYYLRRLRRIYPPLLVAMAISTVIFAINGRLAAFFSSRELVFTLVGLQDNGYHKPGVVSNPYLVNDPLWSLSYELAFYAVFPLVLLSWRWSQRRTSHLVGLATVFGYLSYLAFPNHFSLVAAYFLIWWMGAACAAAVLERSLTLGAIRRELGWLVMLCAASALGVLLHRDELRLGTGYFPLLPLRHFAFTAAVTLGATVPALRAALGAVALKYSAIAAAVASISYSMYVLHYPLLIQWKIVSTVPGFMVGLACFLAACVFTERLLPRILPQAPRD